MTSNARSGSIRNEGTNFLLSGSDCKDSTLSITLSAKASFNTMLSGFVKES